METFVKLKLIRTENGLTQSQVAKALGINRSTYCGYEIGRRKMGTEMLNTLSKFYRLPVSVFFDGDGQSVNDNEHYSEDTMFLSALSDEERELIVKFRILAEKEKSEFKSTIEEISKGEK